MANVFDVAVFVLENEELLGQTPITAMKLQKLVYYSQAWSTVWTSRALFEEPIQAWAAGPVCPSLYRAHRGKFHVEASDFAPSSGYNGRSENLTDDEKDTIRHVLMHYGERPAQWLSDLTHLEQPWIDARGDIPVTDRCENEISLQSMEEYYSGLPRDGE